MSKMSREKGARGEREVADLLRSYGFGAERGVQHQGGVDSPDVRHTMEGFHIEVKRTETLSLYDAIEQALADKKPGDTGLVFHRRNGKPWLVIALADELLKDLKELYL